jgi:hypothetical protein
MSFRELALTFDAQVSPVEAAWAYEVAVNDPDAELELFLNLAVLYFGCADFGYAAHHHLSEAFVSGAWTRAFEILKKAEEKFGTQTELEFWRLYFSFVHLDDESIHTACRELADRKDSLVPYLYLFTASEKKEHLKEARELFESVKDGTTERKRYIKSVLESAIEVTADAT